MLKNQKGFSFIEALLLTPFFLFFLLCLLTVAFIFEVKTTVPAAAREAARQAAAYSETGSSSKGWQKAVDTIQGSLPVTSKTFSPSCDVIVDKEAGYYTALVSYHIPIPVPGLARLLNPDTALLDSHITIKNRAYFPDEEADEEGG